MFKGIKMEGILHVILSVNTIFTWTIMPFLSLAAFIARKRCKMVWLSFSLFSSLEKRSLEHDTEFLFVISVFTSLSNLHRLLE